MALLQARSAISAERLHTQSVALWSPCIVTSGSTAITLGSLARSVRFAACCLAERLPLRLPCEATKPRQAVLALAAAPQKLPYSRNV